MTHPELSYDHNAFLVTDLQRSLQFYSQVLLLKEIPSPFPPESFRWMDLGNHQQLHLILSQEPTEKNKGVHLALKTAHFEAFARHLQENGFAFTDWPGNLHQVNLRPDGIQQLYFQDPDGYWIEINDARY